MILCAHEYEVLFPYSQGYDALNFDNKADFSSEVRGILVDGQIESLGTETTTFDRTLVTQLRLRGNAPLTPKLALRGVASMAYNDRRIKGAAEESINMQAISFDLMPRIELTYFTQNALEVFIGLNYRSIPAYEAEATIGSTLVTEKYETAAYKYPHLGFVKRGVGFKGGFYFQQGAEKARTVEKSNSEENVVLSQEDRVQSPTTLAIFAKVPLGRSQIYGEFAAVQAGELGNRTDEGISVEEDYMRLFFEYTLPPFIPGFATHAALLYKTLSYGDNTNVSLKSIPQFGLHLSLDFELGPILFQGGTIFAYGKDAQSLEEFNANYKLFAVGGQAAVLITF